MFGFQDIVQLIAFVPGILIAMVVHEYAHARAAVAMGDFTPRMMGRLTLNPRAHIDWLGLVMLFFAHFGWAKPVVFNPRNFKNWRQGECLVALAGPFANLLVAFLALLAFVIYGKLGLSISAGVFMVVQAVVLININFAIFNLLPLPPLDGSKVLLVFLPVRWQSELLNLERYSLIILILLLYVGPVRDILSWLSGLVLFGFSTVLSLLF